MLTDVLIQLLSGVSRGMILFVVASGLTLIFGVLRIANFAHGSFYMMAAFTAYAVTMALGGSNFSFVASLIIAPLVVAAFGLAFEFFLLRRIAKREHLYQLIMTFAATLIISDGIKMIWGGAYRSIGYPPMLSGSLDILGRPFPAYYLLVIILGLAIAAGLSWMIERTRFGRTISAAVVDPEMVGALGVNVPRLYTLVFGLGAWLAGVGGALAAPIGSVSLGIDNSIIIESFAVVIIGGSGSIPGALAAALIIGIVQSLGIMVAPRLAIAFIFIALCAVLLLRPQGLLGRRV
ncbi:branched-chain amino acid ABC transporter permease [Rhodoligotrophos defluvii]|uniref:branched-chain amino acid ABC transporter permease n=1 Tax=Rhodoligotrophos defluvii TaxID=2561934 RepID=UPI0010C94A49|nr:branched-chain amino acid ABC transporter permease [Rhodoligotrophos defluvii]